MHANEINVCIVLFIIQIFLFLRIMFLFLRIMVALVLFWLYVLTFQTIFSQITLNRSDFPYPNDIYKVNITTQPFGINLNQTGANQMWDYHNLFSLSSRNDTFLSPWQTPSIYWLFFNGFNTSVALKMPNSFTVGPLLSISEIYNFYYANSSKYELTGFGALINNIPTPVKHDLPDVLYKFPLNYQNKDTSFSSFDVNIPGIGYWKNNQTRYNHVDGWGTLIIPNDTFQVLRLKSEIFNTDSVYLDTLGGFSGNFPRPKQTEYKFLTINGGIPVLQINTQTNQFGIETISSIEYLAVESISRKVLNLLNSQDIVIYPQPAKNQVWIRFKTQITEKYTLQLFDIHGNIIFSDSLNSTETYELKNIPPGLYLVSISNSKTQYTQKILITGD